MLLSYNCDEKKLSENIVNKILTWVYSKKFFDENNVNYSILDLIMCVTKKDENFVMQVNSESRFLKVFKKYF